MVAPIPALLIKKSKCVAFHFCCMAADTACAKVAKEAILPIFNCRAKALPPVFSISATVALASASLVL